MNNTPNVAGRLRFRSLDRRNPEQFIQEVVMYDDPTIVTFHESLTIKGWVSRTGRFFGEGPTAEHSARYEACTHKTCACGKVMEKYYTTCRACRSRKTRETYLTFPEEIDWSYPICSYNDDKFFFHEEELWQYCDDNESVPSDLQLMTCSPQHLPEFDLYESADDILGEDQDDFPFSKEVMAQLKERLAKLNSFIRILPPVSYAMGRKRVTVNFSIDHLPNK